MLPADVIRQVRRLQVRARRAVRGLLGGAYLSAFKGTGLSFDDVREYHPGDDVRRIDWNVTARTGVPFVKRYVEERELTVILAVDLSASLRFGTGPRAKRQVVAELAALLAVAAVGNNDRVGLVGFTNVVEKYVPPARGTRHALRLLRDILYIEPAGKATGLAVALDFLNTARRRRAVVFVFSDFHDGGFDDAFRRAAARHDLIAVRVADPRERVWPDAGLVTVEDAETGKQTVIDTSETRFRAGFAARTEARRRDFDRLARSAAVDVIDVTTDGDHADTLARFFQRRERRRRGRP